MLLFGEMQIASETRRLVKNKSCCYIVNYERNGFHEESFVASTHNTKLTIKPMPEFETNLIIIGNTVNDETFILLCFADEDTMDYSVSEQSLNKRFMLCTLIIHDY